MSSSRRRRALFLGLWGWPLALAALSIFGLLSALLGEGGIWWLLSWSALAMPLAVILRCVARRQRASLLSSENRRDSRRSVMVVPRDAIQKNVAKDSCA